jgi:uncharacterized protein YkwD
MLAVVAASGTALAGTYAPPSAPAPVVLPAGLVSSDEETQFVALINASRAGAGLAPLVVDSELVTYARSHTAEMAAPGKIYHSTNKQLTEVSSGWTLLGENVGLGPNVLVLHDAFMKSPSHRDNILGGFNHVGVGTTYDAKGTLFVTVIFMQRAKPSVAAPRTATTAVLGTQYSLRPDGQRQHRLFIN